jgi:molybdate transport system permease protein
VKSTSDKRLRGERLSIAVTGALLALFLLLPIVALVLGTTPEELVLGLSHPLVGKALRLSLLTTALSLLIVVLCGTPLAWTLATRPGRAGSTIESLVQLPIVIPPAVAGVALLLAFGRRSPLLPEGHSFAFTTLAVVLAQVFVSAPFFVLAAVSAFRRIEPRLIVVARSLGASPWRVLLRVGLPIAAPGLAAGAAMSWARSLGEFGATLMFAGNLEGRTQTLPLAIYTALESDLRAATALSVLLVVVALGVLVFVRAVAPGGVPGPGSR